MDSFTDLISGTLSPVAAVLVAPFVGSFLGVLIQRLPDGRPVVTGRSACDQCGHRLGARDLVPFISYLVSHGRCRHCGQPIGWFPVAVEAAALGVAGWAATASDGPGVWLTCLLGWTLLTAAWIDIRAMILPDVLTLPLLLAGLIVTAAISPDALTDRALAAGLGYLVLAGTALAYRRLRGRDGLGLGDAKLLAALGAWLGLNGLPGVLLLASCSGLLAAGAALLLGKRVTATTAIPFGPFLALAGWLVWLYADGFLGWLGKRAGHGEFHCVVRRPRFPVDGRTRSGVAPGSADRIVPGGVVQRTGRILFTPPLSRMPWSWCAHSANRPTRKPARNRRPVKLPANTEAVDQHGGSAAPQVSSGTSLIG